jgi:DMSO/TMAO reductase YedYZ molybdopterin-dependent catalytic subunit
VRRLAGSALLVAVLLLSAGAGPPQASPPAPDSTLVIEGAVLHAVHLAEADLRHFPRTEERVSFEGEHGQTTATYGGVKLWTLLEQTGALQQSKPRDRVAKVLFATGRDGYTAALALAELDPAFEGKPVLIADAADGHPAVDGGLRLVVPGDRRGGRSVRDVVRIVLR